jgi:hypothetical protein
MGKNAKASRSKLHHFVPRSYLAGFTLNGSKHGRIWILDAAELKIFKSSPAKTAAQTHFNRIDVPGLDPNTVEDIFASIEGRAAPVMNLIAAQQALPYSGDDLLSLSNFVALQHARTPLSRRFYSDIEVRSFQMAMKIYLSSPDRWDQTKDMLKSGEFTPEDPFYDGIRLLAEDDLPYDELHRFVWGDDFVEQMRQRLISNTLHVHNALEAFDAMAPFVASRTWSLLVSVERSTEFVCSDHPVSLSWTVPVEKWRGAPGVGDPLSELVMPLNRQIALVGRVGGHALVLPADRWTVALVNTRTIRWAARYVYSPRDNLVYLRQNEIGQPAEGTLVDLMAEWTVNKRRPHERAEDPPSAGSLTPDCVKSTSSTA